MRSPDHSPPTPYQLDPARFEWDPDEEEWFPTAAERASRTRAEFCALLYLQQQGLGPQGEIIPYEAAAERSRYLTEAAYAAAHSSDIPRIFPAVTVWAWASRALRSRVWFGEHVLFESREPCVVIVDVCRPSDADGELRDFEAERLRWATYLRHPRASDSKRVRLSLDRYLVHRCVEIPHWSGGRLNRPATPHVARPSSEIQEERHHALYRGQRKARLGS